jgi:hypothetical protein
MQHMTEITQWEGCLLGLTIKINDYNMTGSSVHPPVICVYLYEEGKKKMATAIYAFGINK